jgi:hypothetical protein
MSRRRQILVALALGMVGLAGVSLVAMGEGGATDALRAQYAARQARVDVNKTDDLCGLAKWCLQNNLPEEARSNAQTALLKDPNDLRAKYILYAVSSGATSTSTSTDTTQSATATISAADAEKVYVDEGNGVMVRFTTDVLPLLASRCANPKCHGNEKNPKWSLITKDLTERRVVAQNFQAIAKFLNRDSAESLASSKLVMAPTQGPPAHPAIIFRSVNDPAFGRIQGWAKTIKTDLQKIFSASSTPTPTGVPTLTDSAGVPAPTGSVAPVPPPPAPSPSAAAPLPVPSGFAP